MTRNRHNTAFTLIEMLIALAMMATIASMVYGSYAATSRSVQACNRRLDCSERASLALRLVARQIRGAYIPTTDPNTTESSHSVDSTDGPARSALRSQVERSQPIFWGNAQRRRGELLTFATTTGLGGGLKQPQGLSQVRYRHDATTRTLWIDCQPYMNQRSKMDRTASGQPILEQVAAVDVAFYDGRQWLPKWSAAQGQALPKAVRIGLSLIDEAGRSYNIGTTVEVPSRTTNASKTSKRKTGGIRR